LYLQQVEVIKIANIELRKNSRLVSLVNTASSEMTFAYEWGIRVFSAMFLSWAVIVAGFLSPCV
jgi:hypothetical protein